MAKYSVKDFLDLNEKAWFDLYDKHIPRIAAHERKLFGQDIDVEELARDVWRELWERANKKQLTLNNPEFYAYFRQAVRYRVAEFFRKKRYERQAMAELKGLDRQSGPDLSSEDMDLWHAAMRAVVKLDEEPLLRYWTHRELKSTEQITLKELAIELGCSDETARRKVDRLVQRLRNYIEKQQR